jgi:hypothetical protein
MKLWLRASFSRLILGRGSPLIIGVKTTKNLKVDFVDVEFGNNENLTEKCILLHL